jgi:serine phosphatase RsbU (regulator of sigma subunit)
VDGGVRRRIRALLVEDDRGDAFLVSELLAEVDAPVDLTVVHTVAEAKTMLDDFECVVLDLELPDASGLNALRELRQARPQVAVCVLTGLVDEHTGAAALAHGAQDYLVKGRVDGISLERAIRYAVERRHAEDNALLLREAELRQAESSRLERGLLPHPLVDQGSVRLRAFYRAGREMGLLGGDFVDAVQTAPRQVAMLVGDVCGHAAEEAALGVELRVAWRALTLAGVPDDVLLTTLEQILISERRADEIFATLAMIHVDIDRRRVRLRTVGHPSPLLITPDEVSVMPVSASVVLGLVPGSPNRPADIVLPDQRWQILVFTDGLIEGRSGDDRLGTDGLCRLIRAYPRTGRPDRLPEWLVAQAEARNGGPLADDVAMLLLSSETAAEINSDLVGAASQARGRAA